MAENQWYYGEANQQRGPMTREALEALAREGRINSETLVWNAQMPDWRPAGQVTELAQLVERQGGEMEEGSAAVALAEPVAVQPMPVGAVAAGRPGMLGYQAPGQEEVVCTTRAIELLKQTRPWVQLMAIFLYIIGGLVGVGGLIFLGASVLGQRAAGVGLGLVMLVVYGLMALIYLALGVYLWRFGGAISRLAMYRRSNDLEAALAAQKSFWRLAGIILIVVIALYIVIFVVAMLAAVLG